MEKDRLEDKKIGIIGLGNMGKAIKEALLKKRIVKNTQLLTSNSQSSNRKITQRSDILLLCIKPQIIIDALREIKYAVTRSKLVISIAAGVELKAIKRVLGENQPVIRVMPNLAATVNKSISCWVKSNDVKTKDVNYFKKIFKSFGSEIELKKESQLDQVTAVSGSGLAYFFYLTELLENSAIRLGLSKKIARDLVTQTLIGSAELVKRSDLSPRELRVKVTSKGGTTEAAFEKINHSKFKNIFFSAVKSAYIRAVKLHFLNKSNRL